MATPVQNDRPDPIQFNGGLTCSIGVTNLDQSIDWYTRVLGMQLVYRLDDWGWCELSTSVDKVNVGLGVVEQVQQGGGATLTLGVRDIAAAKQTLDELGVRQDGPVRQILQMVRLLTFFDPDGNALMFYQEQPFD